MPLQSPKDYHVDIKGLVFNEKDEFMLLQEPRGTWDLPGGRMEHGETFEQALQRECQEEMGVGCTLVSTQPLFSWPHYWSTKDIWLVYMCFPIHLSSFNFKKTNECCGHGFFTPETVKSVNVIKPLEPLIKWLKEKNYNGYEQSQR